MPDLVLPSGHKIYYETNGQGTPLVALRGLGRSMRHWLGYEKKLAKHFQVITVDARGIGRSAQKPGWMDTVFDLADDVAAVLDDLKITQAHILGVSLGGMVALAIGLKHE